MHDCQDNDYIRVNAVQKGVGETMDQATPDIFRNDRASFGIVGSFMEGEFNFVEEILAKVWHLRFVNNRQRRTIPAPLAGEGGKVSFHPGAHVCKRLECIARRY